MTRINCGIPVEKLSDKHLLAEHREIKRIPNVINSGKAVVENIPGEFCMGKGHVKFFYNKLEYLYSRYCQIYKECLKRGFNITAYHNCFMVFVTSGKETHWLWNDYEPTEQDRDIVMARLRERSPDFYGE